MGSPTRPLSYEASKIVIQYLPVDQRLNIRFCCPQLHTADSVTPLRINTLRMDSHWLAIDEMEYHFICQERNLYGVNQSFNNGAIKITNHKRRTYGFVLGKCLGLETIRSYLMYKMFCGRRTPLILGNFELKKNFISEDMEQNLCFPTDLKMKVKHVELNHVDELVLQQLTNRIIEDPLSSFRVLNVSDLRDRLFKCDLIQKAQKVDIPLRVGASFDLLSVFGEKEVILNNSRGGQVIDCYPLLANQIQARLESNAGSGANITVRTVQQCKNAVLNTFSRQPHSRQAVVDDEGYNRFNIPCVCLPMLENKELVMYDIPGAGTETFFRMKVMPKGLARVN